MNIEESDAHEFENPRRKSKLLREWRRDKVWEYKSMGCTVAEIVDLLKAKPGVKISNGTVCNDLEAKQAQIETSFQHYIDHELPVQHNLAITGLDRVIKESWRIYVRAGNDDKTALAALSTIADATMKKQAVLGDPAQIDKALKTVAKLRKQIEDDQQEVQAQ